MDLHVYLRDLVLILAVAVPVVAGLQRVGVPTIVGFVLAGVLLGPGALSLVDDPHQVEVLAEIGVVLLLFGIGMELSPAKLLKLWRPTLLGGGLQVGLSVAAGWAVARAFSLTGAQGLALGFVLALSSTAVVLRSLATRGETEAPQGRWMLGILLFQDLAVVPMMLAIPLLAGAGGPTGAGAWLGLLGRVVPVLAGVLLAGTLIVPRLLGLIARTRARDLFILTVLLIGVGTAWLTSLAGVSLALGAFLAGTVVAGSTYRHQALADLVPTREVFTSLFFVSVGMLLDPALLLRAGLDVLLLLLAVLATKAAILALVARTLRAAPRVALQVAGGLAGLGEFAFVLLRAGAADLLGAALTERLVAVAILSMLATPLLLAVTARLSWRASRGDDPPTPEDSAHAGPQEGRVVIAGYGVVGEQLSNLLARLGEAHVVVDLNTDNVRRAQGRGRDALFGDVSRPDVLAHLRLAHARELIILISDSRAVLESVRAARQAAPNLHIVARTRFVDEADDLRAAGADVVVTEEGEAGLGVREHLLRRRGRSRDEADEERARLRALPPRPGSASAAPAAAPAPRRGRGRLPWLSLR